MIAVECYSDMALVQCLTSLPREYIAHFFRGKSGVCYFLSNNSNSTGLVDEDPFTGNHPYEDSGESDSHFIHLNIKYLKYPAQSNALIILCPKLEDWIIESARIVHIDITRHGLPDSPNMLHRVIDQKLNEFRIVVNLLKKNNSERIEVLANLLKILE